MRELFDLQSFYEDFAKAAAERGFRGEVLLDTEDGPLMAWEKLGSGPPIYLSAGIHGDEPAGPLAVLEMMERGEFSEDFHWMICPALNPGGLATQTRENRKGKDLNRDYLLQETLEVAAHVRWLERRPVPELFVSMHEDWESTGFYFYEINCGKDRPEVAEAIFAATSEIMPIEPERVIDEHETRSPGWIFHCADADMPEFWPEAIYLAKRGCPLSFTLETPSALSLADRVRVQIAGFQVLLQHTFP